MRAEQRIVIPKLLFTLLSSSPISVGISMREGDTVASIYARVKFGGLLEQAGLRGKCRLIDAYSICLQRLGGGGRGTSAQVNFYKPYAEYVRQVTSVCIIYL